MEIEYWKWDRVNTHWGGSGNEKNLGIRTGTAAVNFIHRIQEMEGIEDMTEEMDTLVKENVNLKTSWIGHYEKTNLRTVKNRRRRRTPAQRPRICFQQNHRGKFSWLKEGHVYKCKRTNKTKNPKLIENQIDWTRKKIPLPHNNQNTEHMNKERILKVTTEKD